jgi:hypothetical protein
MHCKSVLFSSVLWHWLPSCVLPFLWVSEVSLCLIHSNSQLTNSQQLHPHNRLSLYVTQEGSLFTTWTEINWSEVIYDWWLVGQSVLVSDTHLVHDQIFITVRQSRVCWCGAPSQMNGWVYSLWLLLGLASAVILSSKSCRTHILLSQICNSHSLEGHVLYLQPQAALCRYVTTLTVCWPVSVSWRRTPICSPWPDF